MTYRYVPPKRPRKKPQRAAFAEESAFESNGWCGDGYLMVKAALPVGIDAKRSRYFGKDMMPGITSIIKRVKESVHNLRRAVAVGEIEPTTVMLGGGKFDVLVLRIPGSDWYRIVNKAKFDFVAALHPTASVYAEVKNVTSAIVFVSPKGMLGERRRIVGLVMPFQYAKPGKTADRIAALVAAESN